MIWYYIVYFWGNVLNSMFSFLPVVDTLPLGMDSVLSTAVGYFRGLMSIFPPLEVVFTAFLIYVSFRVSLILLNVFKIYHHSN